VPDLLVRTDELAAFVAEAAGAYALDATRILAVGLSTRTSQRACCCGGPALLRPMLPYEPAQQPGLAGTAVLICAGGRDPYSSPEQISRLAEILRAGAADVTLHTERQAGHGLTQEDLQQTWRWVSALTG